MGLEDWTKKYYPNGKEKDKDKEEEMDDEKMEKDKDKEEEMEAEEIDLNQATTTELPGRKETHVMIEDIQQSKDEPPTLKLEVTKDEPEKGDHKPSLKLEVTARLS